MNKINKMVNKVLNVNYMKCYNKFKYKENINLSDYLYH